MKNDITSLRDLAFAMSENPYLNIMLGDDPAEHEIANIEIRNRSGEPDELAMGTTVDALHV